MVRSPHLAQHSLAGVTSDELCSGLILTKVTKLKSLGPNWLTFYGLGLILIHGVKSFAWGVNGNVNWHIKIVNKGGKNNFCTAYPWWKDWRTWSEDALQCNVHWKCSTCGNFPCQFCKKTFKDWDESTYCIHWLFWNGHMNTTITTWHLSHYSSKISMFRWRMKVPP